MPASTESNDATLFTLTSLHSYSMTLPDTEMQPPTAHLACNSMNDILTQSQMLKTEGAVHFVKLQQEEIAGLMKVDVMDVHHIDNLQPRAKLISSIWSYRWK